MTEKTILSVSQLTHAIKQSLEPAFRNIHLQGEISNFKKHSSGHLYFSLKDTNSQITAVMFRKDASTLRKVPKEGDKVIVRGDINVYPPRGNYQIVVKELSLQGLGELLLKLEELKKIIHKRGWFSKEHKKPLPALPRRLGLVTSPTGAAIQDILNVLDRRFFGLHIIVNPVRVQGDQAAGEIACAIKEFNQHKLVDVIIVGRGGGSIEDLWAFNEEQLARVIFESKIPIICSVGHETDHTIAEYVADVRAPTPSAAAEIVVGEKAEKLKLLKQLSRSLDHSMAQHLKQRGYQLQQFLKNPLLTSPYPLVGNRMQRIDDFRDQIIRTVLQLLQRKELLLQSYKQRIHSLSPMQKIAHLRQSLNRMTQMINLSYKKLLEKNRNQIHHLSQTLRAIDPKHLLKKGYSLLLSEEHKLISSITRLKMKQSVKILLSDGEAGALITDLNPEKLTDKNPESCYVEESDI